MRTLILRVARLLADALDGVATVWTEDDPTSAQRWLPDVMPPW